jgi:SAM-dependent methyltransferase
MNIKDKVKQKYGEAALGVSEGGGCCCGPKAPTGIAQVARKSHDIYSGDETAGIPAAAIVASLGCGNPSALARLKPGESVLDLGSGGGVDVFLSARKVGPGGKVYGLDMTDEMLTLSRETQRQAGVENVEFPELWAGCLAGAMQEARYRSELAAAGFVDVDIEPTRIFRAPDVREFLSAAGAEAVSLADQTDGKIMSASVRATRPARSGA